MKPTRKMKALVVKLAEVCWDGGTLDAENLKMNDELGTTDVVVNGPAVVEVDAERIAQIIFEVCHTSEQRAARCANRILDYLTAVHQNAIRPQ
jgi:hypothetical protein